MKTISLLILLILFAFRINGQNCNFNYSTNPGSTVVAFSPNSTFSPNIYHFSWDFGDGNSSSTTYPSHAYNVILPVLACCNIYDSLNVLICSSCDTVSLPAPNTCQFVISFSGVGQGLIACQTLFPTPAGIQSLWDFGDGNTGTGDVVSHIYSAGGTYNICLTQIDSLTGANICSSCQLFVLQGNPNNCTYAYFNNPLTPSTFDFIANVPGGSVVNWDFGDNTTGTGNQISHTFNSVDSFFVCMTTSNCSSSYCQWITNGNPPPYCSFGVGTNPINHFAFSFYAYISNPASSVVWDFGDGSTGIDTTTSHVYSLPGNYLVCMSEVDANGAIICTHCDSVYAGPNTVCNFSYALNTTNSLTANFTANVTGPANSITWDFGDNTTGTGPNPSHTYAASGSYQVCMSVGNSGSIVCNHCQQVWVGGNTGSCFLTFAPDSANANGFIFNMPPSSSSSFIVWDFGDGSVGTGTTVSHVYNNSGVYSVCATETDSFQTIFCHSCIYVTAGTGPNTCHASFINSNLGLDAFFIDLSIANPSLTTYVWSFGDGGTSATRFPQHTYAVPGTYNVCLTIVTGNCTDQFCSFVLVDTIPGNPTGNCQAFFAFVQLAPYQVSVVNLSSGQNITYQWSFGDGTSDTAQFPSHYYQTLGSYNLCLTVSDPNGCSSTYCDTLTVDSMGNVFRSLPGFTINVISPSQLTGVKEIKSPVSFKIFPNPANSEIYFNLSSAANEVVAYRILSLQGSEILSGKLNGFEGAVNVERISPGTYLFELTLSDGSHKYQKVIKN